MREALRLFTTIASAGSPWERLLDEWGLAACRDTAFGDLSGGQRQRLFVALALIGNPWLVVLDENDHRARPGGATGRLGVGGGRTRPWHHGPTGHAPSGRPRRWWGVVGAYVLVAAAFTALGALLGFLMPTARAAQGLGVLLFFVFLMLGGAGPPAEILPAGLARVGDALPVTYAGRLLRGPWLDLGRDATALAVMGGTLVVSLALTAWRIRAEGST